MSDIDRGPLDARMAQIMRIVGGSGADDVGEMWDDLATEQAATPTPTAPQTTAAPAPASGTVGASLGEGQLDGTLQERLNALFAAAPGNVGITSGFRTRAEQEVLYAKYQAGTGNLAAKPGTSRHERGQAADLHYASDAVQQWVLAHAAQFGLAFPISGEPWHAELAGGR